MAKIKWQIEASEKMIEFFEEVIRMNELYKDSRYGLSDELKYDLEEKLDDIQRLK